MSFNGIFWCFTTCDSSTIQWIHSAECHPAIIFSITSGMLIVSNSFDLFCLRIDPDAVAKEFFIFRFLAKFPQELFAGSSLRISRMWKCGVQSIAMITNCSSGVSISEYCANEKGSSRTNSHRLDWMWYRRSHLRLEPSIIRNINTMFLNGTGSNLSISWT